MDQEAYHDGMNAGAPHDAYQHYYNSAGAGVPAQ